MGSTRVPSSTPAVGLLRSWLALREKTHADLARALGCSVSLVRSWLREGKGRRRPSYELAAALERVTDKAVPVGSWADPDGVERAISRGL